MAAVIIPVLLCLFLGPGIGQLYNKDYKKGWILIGVSAVILALAGVWYFKAIQAYLPPDLAMTADPEALQPLLTNAVNELSAKEGHYLSLFKALLTVLWLYGVVDAYLVADKKRRS